MSSHERSYRTHRLARSGRARPAHLLIADFRIAILVLAATFMLLLTGTSVLIAEETEANPVGTYTVPLQRFSVSGEDEIAIVPLGKSRVLKLPVAVGRVSVADPKIADILLLRKNEVYVVGKSLGTTNLVIWDTTKSVQRIIGLEVTHDLATLKEKMHQFLPGENIRIESSRDTIVLSGEVASIQKMDAAVKIARSFIVEAKGGAEAAAPPRIPAG